MGSYKYKLDKSSRKFLCPKCGKKKLVRFVESKTGELQSSEFGRCDREDSCGYFLYPKSVWIMPRNVVKSQLIRIESNRQTTNQKQVFIPWVAYQPFLSGFDNCLFFDYFSNKGVPDDLLEKVIGMYYLGTVQSGYLRGALTIPFITVENNIAFVQVKQFDGLNKTINTKALHSLLKGNPGNQWIEEYEKNDLKVSCFFGAHLLKEYPNNPIALVEAPKTAIYGTCYYGVPENECEFLWLAVYNKSSLTEDKFKVLVGREILVFPDLSPSSSTFNEWKNKVEEFAKKLPNTKVTVFDYLELYAPDELKQSGGDLADYLSQFSWQEFQSEGKSDESDKNDTGKKSFFNDEPEEVDESSDDNLLDLLEQHRSYTIEELETIFMSGAGLNKDDANYCFRYLYNDNALKKTSQNEYYYLATSTPF